MIAMICNNVNQFMNHFNKSDIRHINPSQRLIKLLDGSEYICILNINQLTGWEFESVILAKGYESLEDAARKRVNKHG